MISGNELDEPERKFRRQSVLRDKSHCESFAFVNTLVKEAG